MRRRAVWWLAAGLGALGVGCGEVASTKDGGTDGGRRLFCNGAYGVVDASAASPPATYECTRPQDQCYHGPNGAFICCDPDSGLTCYP